MLPRILKNLWIFTSYNFCEITSQTSIKFIINCLHKSFLLNITHVYSIRIIKTVKDRLIIYNFKKLTYIKSWLILQETISKQKPLNLDHLKIKYILVVFLGTAVEVGVTIYVATISAVSEVEMVIKQ